MSEEPQPSPSAGPVGAIVQVAGAVAPGLVKRVPELVTMIVLVFVFLYAQDRALERLGKSLEGVGLKLDHLTHAVYELDLAPAQQPREDGP